MAIAVLMWHCTSVLVVVADMDLCCRNEHPDALLLPPDGLRRGLLMNV
jgi:hypothetical protein